MYTVKTLRTTDILGTASLSTIQRLSSYRVFFTFVFVALHFACFLLHILHDIKGGENLGVVSCPLGKLHLCRIGLSMVSVVLLKS